jgi:hypothetical protein
VKTGGFGRILKHFAKKQGSKALFSRIFPAKMFLSRIPAFICLYTMGDVA